MMQFPVYLPRTHQYGCNSETEPVRKRWVSSHRIRTKPPLTSRCTTPSELVIQTSAKPTPNRAGKQSKPAPNKIPRAEASLLPLIAEG